MPIFVFYILFVGEIAVGLQNEKDLEDLDLEVKTERRQADIEEVDPERGGGVAQDQKIVSGEIEIVVHTVGKEKESIEGTDLSQIVFN